MADPASYDKLLGIFTQKKKQTNSLSFHDCKDKLTLKGQQHNFVLFHFVYIWRTLPPKQLQTMFWGPYSALSSEFVLQPH